jgi:hypothetical protein
MMRRGWNYGKGAWLASLSGVALLSWTTLGNADEARSKERRTCAASFERAQEMIHGYRLRKARAALLACAKPVCGKVLARECNKEIAQLESDIPSVVLSAKNDTGTPMVDVEVAMDGEPLTSHLDGRAVSVDPGVHQFLFKGADSSVDLVSIPIAQGERNRAVTVQLQRASATLVSAPKEAAAPKEPVAAAASASPIKAPARAEASVPERAPVSSAASREAASSDAFASAAREPFAKETAKNMTLPYVAGTVGLAGLAGFGILYAIARNDNNNLTQCWPTCSESRIGDVRKLYVAADVSLGVGVAALGAATWLYFSTKSPSDERPSPKAPRYSVDVQPSRTGFFTSFSGAF